jgi:hypothetical protein
MYLDFGYREDFFSLVRRHVEAFQYFGGIPHRILYDNMKTVVVRWEGDVPLYNPRFLLFATHYGFKPRACRPHRPQTKGKIERPNRTIKENFLNGREFSDDEHLRDAAREWLVAWDLRPHRTTGRPPGERFQEELSLLLPLPRKAYDTREVAYRLVSLEGLVSWDGSHYSAPPAVVGQIVVVTADPRWSASPSMPPGDGGMKPPAWSSSASRFARSGPTLPSSWLACRRTPGPCATNSGRSWSFARATPPTTCSRACATH